MKMLHTVNMLNVVMPLLLTIADEYTIYCNSYSAFKKRTEHLKHQSRGKWDSIL